MAIQISGNSVIDNNARLTRSLISLYESPTVISTNTSIFDAVNRQHLYVNVGAVTIRLPQLPFAGAEVLITVGNFTSTAVNTNGNRIMGLAENLIIDVPYSSIRFIYANSTLGWRIT